MENLILTIFSQDEEMEDDERHLEKHTNNWGC
jgi:hypothetical protein